MTAWTVLALCRPSSVISIIWIAAITTPPHPAPRQAYVPPPITNDYVAQQIAHLEAQLERQ